MYLEHFGFLEPPFNLTADPAFIYSNRGYQEAFTGLRWGIRLRQGLMVVTGEVGMGKTTLLRLIKTKLELDIHTAVITSCNGDFTDLLRQMLGQFGQPHADTDRVALMKCFRSYLAEQYNRNHGVAVLVDEAQDLEVSALKGLAGLLDLEIDSKPSVQIVLAGACDLEAKLDCQELTSMKQCVTRWCRLAPLARHEISAYIDCRVARAGYAGSNLFSAEAAAQIAMVSNGTPRLINIVCDNALLAAYSLGRSNVSLEIVQKVSRELRLAAPACLTATSSENAEKTAVAEVDLKTRDESLTNQAPVFRQPVIRARRRRHQRFSSLRIAGLSVVFLLAAGAVVRYSQLIEPSPVNRLAGDGSLGHSDTRTRPEHFFREYVGDKSPIQASTARNNSEFPSRMKTMPQLAAPEVLEAGRDSTKVFFHTSDDRDRAILGQVGAALRIEGYAIPDTRISSSPTQGDVRFFFTQDRRTAERVKSIIEAELQRLGYRISLQILERDGKKFQFAAPGKIEVWMPPLANVLLARSP